MSELEFLSQMEYPGRFIALGATQSGVAVAVYGMTVRSTPYQKRKLVAEDVQLAQRGPSRSIDYVPGLSVQPTEPTSHSPEEAERLFYPAMIFREGITVGNGAQTKDLAAWVKSTGILHALEETQGCWEPEPDQNQTPRISGHVEGGEGVLGIIKKGRDGTTERYYFGMPLLQGQGKFLSTYDGPNSDPTPSFSRVPIDFQMPGVTPQETAQAFYNAIRPIGNNDIRVAVAAAYLHQDVTYTHAVINRHQR